MHSFALKTTNDVERTDPILLLINSVTVQPSQIFSINRKCSTAATRGNLRRILRGISVHLILTFARPYTFLVINSDARQVILPPSPLGNNCCPLPL